MTRDSEVTEQALKPGARKVVANTLMTLGVAAVLCWWAARSVSSGELRAGFEGIRLFAVLATMTAFGISFFTVDVLGFGMSWRRHLAPDIPWRDVRALVCGKQVFFLVLPLLTKVVAPLAFWRRLRVRPLHTVSASELVNVSELTAIMGLVSVTLIVSDVAVGFGLTAVVVAWWIAASIALLWLTSPRLRQRLPRLQSAALLHAFTRARPREVAIQVGLRGAHQLITLMCVWTLLAEMGTRLSVSQLLSFGPLFIFSSFLPISLAGYGGPQGLAVALLADRWGLLSPGRALAFSLVWSTGLLVLQTGVGLAHLPRMIELLRAPPAEPAAEVTGHG
jgi:hypothetical protein